MKNDVSVMLKLILDSRFHFEHWNRLIKTRREVPNDVKHAAFTLGSYKRGNWHIYMEDLFS